MLSQFASSSVRSFRYLFLVVSLTFSYLKDVRDECEKLKETISSKDKKLARMNKAFGNKVNALLKQFITMNGLSRKTPCLERLRDLNPSPPPNSERIELSKPTSKFWTQKHLKRRSFLVFNLVYRPTSTTSEIKPRTKVSEEREGDGGQGGVGIEGSGD